ncbi:hypothetical protein ACH4TI_15000 [Streptomyces rochei]|uniref:hypothetical protein n=1 Tax=Streptomyces rochei TaxID=1928 RepID=UPI0037B2C001
MTICARCDEPIEGEPERVMTDAATGAGEVLIHPGYCKVSSTRQTYPVERPEYLR